jgi:hypothetical protein
MLGASGSASASKSVPSWHYTPPDDTSNSSAAAAGLHPILVEHRQQQQQQQVVVAVAVKQRSQASGSRNGTPCVDDEDSDSFDKAPAVNELFLINQVDLPREMQVRINRGRQAARCSQT